MNEELKKHTQNYLKTGVRFDGRKEKEFRKVEVEYGITNTAEGSARVKLGGTEVIAGVKMSIEKPYPDQPDKGTIMIGAELLPMSNPDFELGPPSIQAIELARVIDRGIRESEAIDFKTLCLKRGEKVWILSVDICPINDEGNLFDASSLAVLAALKDAKFPTLEVTDDKGETKEVSQEDYAKTAEGAHVELNYKKPSDKGLELRNQPLSVTVLKIDDRYIVDPITEEEGILDARLSVATTEDKTITAMQKGGDQPLSIDEISTMIDIATEKAGELRKHLG